MHTLRWLLPTMLLWGTGVHAAGFETLDADFDGRLSLQETLDRNGDGLVSLEEVVPHRGLLRWWQGADRDGSGDLDRSEFAVFELHEMP